MSRWDDDDTGTFASPPCFMHEFDSAEMGVPGPVDPRQQLDVKRWRKAERARLIKDRLAIPVETRRRHDAMITENLEAAIGAVEDLVIAIYWPFRGEPNLLPFLERVEARGGRCALPVVVEPGRPLIFRLWSRDDQLEKGVWNIPIPRAEAPVAVPDRVISPVVGFDSSCFRLGYGGGFYDRTLSALPGTTSIFGVGYSQAWIPTVYPQWYDIPMEEVVTEDGTWRPGHEGV